MTEDDWLRILKAVKTVEGDKNYDRKEGCKWKMIHDTLPSYLRSKLTAAQLKVKFNNLVCEVKRRVSVDFLDPWGIFQQRLRKR